MKKKAEELIRSLVPELQELKEGCFVVFNELPLIPLRFIFRGRDCVVGQYKDGSRGGLGESKYTILRSDIHLEHVLKAIKTLGADDNYSNSCDSFIMWVCVSSTGICDEFEGEYDLSKPFQEQSEEFYKFIVDILK